MDPMSAVMGIGGLGLGLWNGFQQQRQLDWMNGAFTDRRDFARRGFNDFMGFWNDQQNPMLAASYGLMNPALGGLQDILGGYADNANQLGNQMMRGWGAYFDENGWMTPEQQAAMAEMQGLGGAFGGLGDLAGQGFAGGGWSQQGQNNFDFGNDFANLNTPEGQAAQEAAMQFFGNRGQTGFNNMVLDRSSDALNRGGMTNTLDGALTWAARGLNSDGQTDITRLLQSGGAGLMANGGMDANGQALSQFGNRELQGNLGTGGLTGTGAAGMQVALQGLADGGQTAFGNDVQNYARELMADNPLMTMEQAIAQARDQAGTASAQQFEAMQRNAMARGGGAGTNVANGATNRGLSEFSEQAAANEAAAMRAASQAQQQLGLAQQTTGIGAGVDAMRDENARLGTFGGLLGNLEGVAAQRFGLGGNMLSNSTNNATGRFSAGAGAVGNAGSLANARFLNAMEMMPQVQGLANQNMQILGNLGLGAEGSQQGFMNTANNTMGNMNQMRLGGLNANNAGLGNMNSYALGLGGLANSAFGNRMNVSNNIFGNMMAGRNQGMNAAQTYGGLANLGFGARTQGLGALGNLYQTGFGGLQNRANQLAQFAQNFQAMEPTPGTAQAPTAFGQVAGHLMGGR